MASQALLLFILIVGILIIPVSAWNNNLNNADLGPLWGGTYSYVAYPYSDTTMLQTAAINFPYGPSASYYAYNNVWASPPFNDGYTSTWPIDSSGTSLVGISTASQGWRGANPEGCNYGRVEVVRTGDTTWNQYCDGVFHRTATSSIDAAESFGVGSSSGWGENTYMYADDLSWSNAAADTGIVAAQPHNWYILKDFLNPYKFGQYDENDNLVSSSEMHFSWSLGARDDGWTIASPPDTRYTIVIQSPTGQLAYNQHVDITSAAHAFGFITLPFNDTYIGDSPLEYGMYFVTLYDASFVKSIDYFQVIATGANLYWNANKYTASDVGVVTYNVDSGYWIPATYDYKVIVKNIYGVQKYTTPITAASGSVSVDLNGYDQGVYYAQVIAVQKSTPTNQAVLGNAVMEITDYSVFNGYVMDEETGATLPGATVDIVQSTLNATVTAGSTGGWVSDNSWLTGTATQFTPSLAGYDGGVVVFTPSVAKNVTVNLTMSRDSPTTVGVSIGGVVRDTTYSNPVVGAIYTVQNRTTAEYYSAITNIAGFARVDNLVANRTYEVWSSKLGFGNSTVVLKEAVGV